jgi:hypothetical protein
MSEGVKQHNGTTAILEQYRPSDFPTFGGENFWHPLIRDAWKREPLVFRQPFGSRVFTPDEAFEAWHGALQSLKGTRRNDFVRFYRGYDRVLDPTIYAPTAKDKDLRGYLERLVERYQERNWGFCLSKPHVLSPSIFRKTLSFLDQLYCHVGFYAGGAVPNLFFMNHDQSFFRLHKDDQDVFTFVIEGSRRFLLWPFAAFQDLPDVNRRGALCGQLLHSIGIDPFREAATVVKADAGDVS